MKKFNILIAAALIAALPAFAGSAVAESKKVFVELFTSQGCSSCPPAEKFLAELARRDDLIALEFHVDYWGYLGWKDPFSSAEFTKRQHAYAARMNRRYVYTPQMVMNGTEQATGSRRGQVLRAIEAARALPQVGVSVIKVDHKTAMLNIDGGFRLSRTATVWLFAYDQKHTTKVLRGENAGQTLVNTNVVRAIRNVGTWRGQAKKIKLPLSMMGINGQDRCAIVIQDGPGGRIYGAVDFTLLDG